MKKMTSRERVRAAIERREVDCIPLHLQIESHTAVTIGTAVRPPRNPLQRAAIKTLRAFSESVPNSDIANGAELLSYLFTKDYMRELGADITEYHWSLPPMWVRDVRFDGGRLRMKDIYGVTRGIGGLYFETIETACPDPESLSNYTFPDMSNPIHYAHVAMARRAQPDAFITGFCPGAQDWGQSFHPMEKLYSGMIEYPHIIKQFFWKLCEHSLQIIRGMTRAGVDAVTILDDYGTQNSMLISKRMWAEFTYPVLRRQIEEIHRGGAKAMLHSCGVVTPLLDLFVEAGLDALHPFQPLPGNNLAEAKARFGDRLCFLTGIDVQRISERTPDEVYTDIVETSRVAAEGGGFILAHTNGLQNDTPVENLKAMFQAIDDVKKGI